MLLYGSSYTCELQMTHPCTRELTYRKRLLSHNWVHGCSKLIITTDLYHPEVPHSTHTIYIFIGCAIICSSCRMHEVSGPINQVLKLYLKILNCSQSFHPKSKSNFQVIALILLVFQSFHLLLEMVLF